jgi:hypothetical protein
MSSFWSATPVTVNPCQKNFTWYALARSTSIGGAVLSILVLDSGALGSPFNMGRVVFQDMSRIRQIRLPLSDFLKYANQYLLVEAPFIESFQLYDDVGPMFFLKEMLCVGLLFGGCTPCLRDVQTSRWMDWTLPLLSGLTFLKVTNVPPNYRATLPQLYEILGGMPHLQLLHLEECLPLDTNVSPTIPISLDRLGKFHLSDHSENVVQLAECIAPAYTSQIQLCSLTIKEHGTTEQLSPQVREIHQRGKSAPKALFLYIDTWMDVHVIQHVDKLPLGHPR